MTSQEKLTINKNYNKIVRIYKLLGEELKSFRADLTDLEKKEEF